MFRRSAHCVYFALGEGIMDSSCPNILSTLKVIKSPGRSVGITTRLRAG
jgi:hypothetical protein